MAGEEQSAGALLGGAALLLTLALVVYAAYEYAAPAVELGGVAAAEPPVQPAPKDGTEGAKPKGDHRHAELPRERSLLPAAVEPTSQTAEKTDDGDAQQQKRERKEKKRKRKRKRRRKRKKAVEQQMRRVPVKMYVTRWCPHCERARDWLRAGGYRFTEYDVEADRSAARKLRRLNPGGGVPTIVVDGLVLDGFSAQSLERALRKAAERRLDG